MLTDKVTGKISNLLKGIDIGDPDIVKEYLMDVPITVDVGANNTETIGRITEVYPEKDLWIAEINIY